MKKLIIPFLFLLCMVVVLLIPTIAAAAPGDISSMEQMVAPAEVYDTGLADTSVALVDIREAGVSVSGMFLGVLLWVALTALYLFSKCILTYIMTIRRNIGSQEARRVWFPLKFSI